MFYATIACDPTCDEFGARLCASRVIYLAIGAGMARPFSNLTVMWRRGSRIRLELSTEPYAQSVGLRPSKYQTSKSGLNITCGSLSRISSGGMVQEVLREIHL